MIFFKSKIKDKIKRIKDRALKKGYSEAKNKYLKKLNRLKQENNSLKEQHDRDIRAYKSYIEEKKKIINLYDVLEMDIEHDRDVLLSIYKRHMRKQEKVETIKRKSDRQESKIFKLMRIS